MTVSKLTDAITYALSVGLAAGCIAFAAYKVVMLNSLENPPANMGLSFPPAKRKIITDEPVAVDSMTTGSTGVDSSAGMPLSIGRPLQPYADETPIEDYKLLAVIDGVAFVEVLTPRGRDILPVSVGTRLPGAGPVERIERIDGHWVLVAGAVKLAVERRQ